jgi:hypothetical protein
MSVTRVAKTLRGGNEFFIACRKPAPDVSRLGRDLARILLCDATAVVVMFSSLSRAARTLVLTMSGVVGIKCRGRISPIPVKNSAIQAGRMVVHLRGRGGTRGSRSELRRLASPA